MQTLQQFIDEHNGKQLEIAGSANAKFQCVDLANGYIRDVLGLPIVEWTNAQDFPSKCLPPNYEYIKNSDDNFPLKGNIVIWKSKDGIGHIAVCIEDGNKNNFKSFDQNWSKPLYCTLETHIYTGSNHQVIGWLKPKINNSSTEKPMTNDQTNSLKILEAYRLEKGHGNLEGTVNAIIGSDRDIQGVRDEKLNLLKSNCLFLSELVKSEDYPIEKIQKVTEYQKLEVVWQSLSEVAKKFIENLVTEKNTNFTQYRNKNDEFNALKTMVGNFAYLLDFIVIKFKNKSIEDYLKEKLPLVIKQINNSEKI